MAEPNEKEKDAAKGRRRKKPIEYRRFERLLRKVIASPPVRRPSPGEDARGHEGIVEPDSCESEVS